MVIETQSTIGELREKNLVLLAKVVDNVKLPLIHPAGNGDSQKPEWVENSSCSAIQKPAQWVLQNCSALTSGIESAMKLDTKRDSLIG